MADLDRAVLRVAGATVTLVGGGLAVVAPQVVQATDFPVTDEGSLRQAILSANVTPGADTITIAAGTITLSSYLPNITEELVITGAGQGLTIIDGDDAYKAFYAESSVSLLTVSDMTIQHTYDTGGGPAIHAHGSLMVSDVTFTNNIAKITSSAAIYDGQGGGAIFVHDTVSAASVTIVDSTFTYNQSLSTVEYYGSDGGAVRVDFTVSYPDSAVTTYNSVSITNSTFTGNYSSSDGAGVSVDGDGVVTITGSTFTGNSVYNDGGAVSIDGASSASVSTSTFTNNTSKDQGGALYFDSSSAELTVDDSTFTNNYADEGGAIAMNAGSLTVTDSTFHDNGAEYDGGAIYAVEGFTDQTITVIESVFTDNEAVTDAEGEGGAIFSGRPLSVVASTFSGNVAGDDGGAINVDVMAPYVMALVDEPDLVVQDSTFAANYSYDDGGAIFVADSVVRILQSTFYGNSSNEYGGAIAAFESTLEVSNSTIVGNSAGYAGGAIYADGTDVQIDNTILWDNTDSDSNEQIVGEATLSGANNLEGVDPMLNPLGDNGGLTLTMLPKIGSPALDAGNNAIQPFAEDQRGSARVYKDVIDIGAVEATAEERAEVLPPTGAGAERAAWLAALLAGVGAVFTFGARRPSRRS